MLNTSKNITISLFKRQNNIKKTSGKKNAIISIVIIIIIAMIVIKPNLCINSIYSGLAVWAKSVLPSLFPFMFFTKLLTNYGFISKITAKSYKATKLLFNAPKISSYIFLMSIISGYPVGAKLISEYHKMGYISTKQANKLSTFCSTSGPLFIIGSVGTAMFGNVKIGYIMLISHILGAVFNGILFRKFFIDKTETNFKNDTETQNSLQNSMKDSILSVLLVGGFIAVAFLVIDLLNETGILSPINYILNKLFGMFGLEGVGFAFTNGLLEVSKGCLTISSLDISLTAKAVIGSFLIGFGGISILLQAITFLTGANVNLKFYTIQKITHGIFSAIICLFICLLFGV